MTFKSRKPPTLVATVVILGSAIGIGLIFPRTPIGVKAAQEEPAVPQVREELIIKGSPAQIRSAYYNPASRRLIAIESREGKEKLLGDGWPGEYQRVGRVTFSNDGLHAAFSGTRNNRSFAVLDGKEVGDYERVDKIALSPDGKHMAFYARKNKQWILVVDGNEGPSSHGLEFVSPPIFGFSPDSRRLAYLIDLGKNNFHLVVGDVRTECKGVTQFLFSADSQHWAALVRKGFLGRPVVVSDGQELSFKLDAGTFQFNPATGKVAVIGLQEGWNDKFVMAELHEIHLPEKYKYTLEVSAAGINFSVYGLHFTDDGKHDVYAIHDSRGEDVFADGEIIFSTRTKARFWWQRQSSMPWGLADLALSGDGRQLAIAASRKDRVGILLLRMGEESASGRWTVLESREIETPVKEKAEPSISNLRLSPTGKHVALEVHTKQEDFVVVDGQEGRHYESSFNLQRRVGFVEDLMEKRGCYFDTEDSVTCIVAKADGLYRVTQTAPSTSPFPVSTKR